MLDESVIAYIKGDLLLTKTMVIAHQVNNRGVMGAGVALALSRKFPGLKNFYKNSDLSLGNCIIYDDPISRKIVANLVAQDGYGRDRQYTDYIALENSFHKLAYWMNNHHLGCVAMPKIGCGLGGGSWDIVKEIINRVFYYRNIRVEVYIKGV